MRTFHGRKEGKKLCSGKLEAEIKVKRNSLRSLFHFSNLRHWYPFFLFTFPLYGTNEWTANGDEDERVKNQEEKEGKKKLY